MKRTVTIDDGTSSAPPARRTRRSKSSGKRSGKSQISRSLGMPNGVHLIRKVAVGQVQVCDQGFNIGGTVNNFFSMQFGLQNAIFYVGAVAGITMAVPGYADLSGLFDQIMLDQVVVKFQYLADPVSQPSNATGSAAPLMYHCIDYNDASIPANLGTVTQYGNVRSKCLSVETGPVIRKIQPKFPQVVYASAVSSSYKAARGFLTNNIDVPHYGLKGGVVMATGAGGGTNIGFMNIEVAYTFQCKNTV